MHCRVVSEEVGLLVETRMAREVRWGKREIIYLTLHCHHQNDSGIKMGNDSLIVNGQCHKTLSTYHNF